MAYKPHQKDSINRLDKLPEVDFNEQQFVEDIFNDEYLLVVGSEVILNKEIEPTGDISQYILRSINSNIGKDYKDFNELETHSEQGVDIVRNLLNDKDFYYDIEDISQELRDLLETKVFRFILTTTYDAYLETLMYHIWGDKILDDVRQYAIQLLNESGIRDRINEIMKDVDSVTAKEAFDRAKEKLRDYVYASSILNGSSNFTEEELEKMYTEAQKRDLWERITQNNKSDVIRFHHALMDKTYKQCKDVLYGSIESFVI